MLVLGTYQRQDKYAYIIDLIVQFFMPAMIISGIWWLPESPRWLVFHGRREEALKALIFLRGDVTLAEEEVVLLEQAFEEQQSEHAASVSL